MKNSVRDLRAQLSWTQADLAEKLGVSRQTVSTWRQRYAADGLDGLRDRPHPGRPSVADEADIVTRTLLGAAGHRSARAIARDTGLSHTLVASVRQRWNLTPDHSSVPTVPARPPLPNGEIWVLGLYHDAHRTVILLGSYPRRAAAPAAAPVRASTLDAVDAALDAAASSAGTDPFVSFLLEGRGRHPDVRLHAVVLRGGAPGPELVDCCARAQVSHHLLPPRTTWRSFTRAVIGIDCARHPESSQRVHLDLAAALSRFALPEQRRDPVRWLRESLPVEFGDRPPLPAARRRTASSGVNQIDLGSFNECVVIEAVRLAGSITRGEISERTRLTQQSVSRITRSLIQRGLLVEDRQRYATIGKPRTPVRLRDDAAHAIGIHVDPEILTVVLVELSGSIVAGRSEPVTVGTGPQQLVDQLGGLTERVLAAVGQGIEDETFLGIGVATPGPVDTESGTILDPPLMPVWRDVPLMSLLKKRFTCPIAIEKDSTAAAVGERWIGRERRARDFVYLYLGTGVGAGLFLNGDIYRGLSANAGEFGQLCAVALGRVDSDGRPEILPECNPGGKESADAIRQVAAAIGRGALGMVDLLDVGLVVVGGPFCTDNVADLYLTEIERVVNDFPTARRLRHVSVERSVNGQETAAVGAASTIFHTTFTPRLRG